ncbi:stage II sporulation protein D [Peribacillus muralis]|uniref:stage II sporulation protein D n=1 Tax=Peribacillus muralis TaxID=264697 RepID=UPI001F4D401D|nr:stage II sporulation protein D [Peribacillus muralis]MCK1994515.1 stage II sporulation protein D [Peribacillus muralis]MCK2015251.1 stage II sporulation protein D [Peribacillus muralis]
MKAIKPMIILFIAVAFVIIMIPAVLVLPFSNDKTSGELAEKLVKEKKENSEVSANEVGTVEVAVYRTTAKKIEKVAMESYLTGVVAAEMPADFEEEALKAQALTARTYIVNQLISKSKLGLPDGADVSDTIMHQVYLNNDELKKQWGSDYKSKMKKINKAIKETEGQILTYEGKPITATFFSTSNGYTENSEDYWQADFPYLRSVSSPWDKEESPKFYNKVVVNTADFEQKLGVSLSSGTTIGTVVERTSGNRVGIVDIGGKKLTGKQIREKLGLTSSDFNWERQGQRIVITTKGSGHGVGMSQYGANGMAREGKSYEDIVKYYYKGVEVQSSNKWMNTMTAKK